VRHYDGSYRSTREAFSVERFSALFGPYRRSWRDRHGLHRALSWALFLGVVASLGVMLAWRG
jgi:polyferredoxin